jgi:protein O-GlcNAc transferase
MGECLAAAGEGQGAFQAYAQTVATDPRHAEAFFRIMDVLYGNVAFGKLKERLEAAPTNIRRDPRWFMMSASADFELGDGSRLCHPPAESRSIFKRVPAAAALQIRAMVYDSEVSGRQLLEATREWDRQFGPARPADIPIKNPDPDRPLRIGLVNTRMRHHNVGMQQHALMKHRPRSEECTLHLYASNDRDDGITEELKTMADSYTSIAGMPGAEAAKRIRSDEIDILIDFNEYTNDGRLDIFSLRAAPIQVHYYGNAVTTGLRAMDYRISDAVSEPPGEADENSAEKIIRLEAGYHLYTPPRNAAPLRFDSPVTETGYVTFGGIHHLAKYTARVLESYRRILEAIPTARLLLARKHFEDAGAVALFSEKLKQHGLPMDRVAVRGDYGAIGSLAIWQEVDCVLDTFPFAGDATAVESLYAGVPMITLMGSRISSRRSASVLTRIGSQELIAHDEDDYVSKAIALGESHERLNAYRATIHNKMASSTICTHAESAQEMFRALRQIWRDAVCSNEIPK